MREFGTLELLGYAVFAALFLAVVGLHPVHAVDVGSAADAAAATRAEDAATPSR
ncbi:MAG: hypothetical protein WDM91_20425 [Rhizomicrobium sp.]